MTITPEDAVAKLAGGYWNSDPVSSENPGGFDEAVDGSRAGHEENIPAALEAVGVAAQHVGQTATEVDDAAATAIAAMQGIAAGVAGQLATTVPVSTQGRDLVAATTPDAAAAVLAGRVWCGTSGGTSNALTLTPVPALSSVPVGTVVEFVAGLSNVAVTRKNLLTSSRQVGAAAWSKTGTAVTENVLAAPSGDLTADKIAEDGSNGPHLVYQVASSTETQWTASFTTKSAERSRLTIVTYNNAAGTPSGQAIFDLSSGAVVSKSGSLGTPTATIDPAGAGYYRCSVTPVLAAAGTAITSAAYITSGTATNYLGTAGSGSYLCDAHLEPGASSTPDIPTTTAPVTVIDGHSTLNVSGLGAKWLLDANGAALAVGAVVAGTKYHATWDGASWRLAANTDIPAGLTYRLDQLSRNSVLAMTSGGRL